MPLPFADVARSATLYQRKNGLHVPEARYNEAYITEPASQAIGAAYGRLPEFDHGAVPAYRAMREETMRQYDHMTSPRSRGGMGLNVEITKHDPYQGSDVIRQVRHDVEHNGTIKAMATASTGEHPFFSNDDNDAFRAVHDVYGHLGSGRGVDFSGEEAAYQKHSRMFSPLARQALATETRGQNSALRLHGDFQDQKVALLPDHLQSLQFSRTGSGADRVAAIQRARSKNAEQGL